MAVWRYYHYAALIQSCGVTNVHKLEKQLVGNYKRKLTYCEVGFNLNYMNRRLLAGQGILHTEVLFLNPETGYYN